MGDHLLLGSGGKIPPTKKAKLDSTDTSGTLSKQEGLTRKRWNLVVGGKMVITRESEGLFQPVATFKCDQ